MVTISSKEYLAHYGILRKSGRYPYGSGGDKEGELYPWASGDTQSQRNITFLAEVDKLKKKGLSDTEIAEGFGIKSTQFRSSKSIARNEEKQSNVNQALRLRNKGLGHTAIARRMSVNGQVVGESQVRAWLQPGVLDKLQILNSTSDTLRKAVDAKKYVDVGSGTNINMGVSTKKLSDAVDKLRHEGYELHSVKVDQLGTNHQTRLKVLVAPGTEYKDLIRNKDKISQPIDYSHDGGRSFTKVQPPIQVDPKRVAVRYAEEGGKDTDGVIYVRPGVDDLTLGGARYAQVRIAVGDSHYLKGMAMYKDALPAGTDILFNTNKSDTGNKLDAMKPIKDDPHTAGFGSIVRQLPMLDVHGDPINNTVRSAMNIVNDEGTWDEWTKSLSSQFLSKQSTTLAKTQLDKAHEESAKSLEQILKVDNPAVKKHLLEKYADSADSAAVQLKAAALPRQRTQVILPIESMKPNEVYAPNFENGSKVVLVRHPHGGPFEIPELTVNNNQPEARKLLGNAKDAIGIHASVAAKMSGADFDGDTVLVIPNDKGEIKHAPTLEGLKGFDPQSAFPKYEGMHRMTPRETGLHMGMISNLITDMTIRGANNDELARAVRHSMVVIDAEKHYLDYKSSARDNGISALKKKYQGENGGASTIVSAAKSEVLVPERKQTVKIDPVSGKKIYTDTGASYVQKGDKLSKTPDKNGNYKVLVKDGTVVYKREKVTKLGDTDDAHSLLSDQAMPIEVIYADHSNNMKALANRARLEMVHTKTIPYSPSAARAFAPQVKRLTAALTLAQQNAPNERRAQLIAGSIVEQKRAANPDMDDAELKKTKRLELESARLRTGAKKPLIEISDDEWSAIQAGAISNKKLTDILANTDIDKIKDRATPTVHEKLSSAMKNRAVLMLEGGATQVNVAEALGVSLSTLKRELKDGNDDNA